MAWTVQNLISSQKYLILDLQKGQLKSVSSQEKFTWENYFIGIMFLHKFDILNRNLTGLYQKFMPVRGCDEIMRRDEIRWFDGTWKPKVFFKVKTKNQSLFYIEI